MFSATLHSHEVRDIAKRICHQPTIIDLKVKHQQEPVIHHTQILTEHTQ